MPRRISTRAVTSSATPHAPPVPQPLETPYDSNIRQLRRHWKWAAFSQFFFTFSPLLAMGDVALIDVENDLVHSTNQVLSRIMQRLLITLTQDRKITPDSWQNALRRQYQRRDPDASPIGLISRSKHFVVESSRASTAPPGTLSDVPIDEPELENEPLEPDHPTFAASSPDNAAEGSVGDPECISVAKVEEEDTSSEVLEAPEKQVDWLDLSMLAKLESLHTLAEWQFQNPLRIRQQMKTDDEQATWRIEPIGYDSKGNAYRLIGDRLWIQREPPKPDLKRKRKREIGGSSRDANKEQPQSIVKRRRMDRNSKVVGRAPVTSSTRNKAQSQQSPSPRGGRAAKMRANQRLDAQAKDLAEFRRQITCSRNRTTLMTPRKPTGIRVSARLRGTAAEEDEWQEVPDEWLAGSDTHRSYAQAPSSSPLPSGKQRMKTGLESDDSSISELTELSDGEDGGVGLERDMSEEPVVDAEAAITTSAGNDPDVEAEVWRDEVAKLVDPPITPHLPDNFVEWETICVTLEEWENIGQQFEKALHYAEKALHKVLSQNIIPMITAELREVEKKRRLEEAVVHRKRSSRIAMKEIEKEEERVAVRKRLEEEEKMGRARRLEARQQREQVDRLKRENAREKRRRERELREQQSAEEDSKPDVPADTVPEGTSSILLLAGKSKATTVAPINGTGSGSRSPVENWELDCEVCGRKGINQDDGVPLLCCGVCGRWQHIVCHDRQDALAGHPKRNWDAEDFICRQCRLITSKSLSPSHPANFLSPGVNSKRGQVSGTQAIYGLPLNHPGNYPNNGYYQDPPSNTRYPHDHSDIQTTVPLSSPSSHSYTPQTRPTGVTFAHYQPQQGGFSTSRPTYSVQDASSQHARYTITPHTVSTNGTAPYPPTLHTQTMTPSPTRSHEQWFASSAYPRTNSYPINGGAPLHAQGAQPYYNGHAHTSYSHMRGATNSTVLGHYAGLQHHVPSYQHSK